MAGTVVIIVNYESGDRLRTCLASLRAQVPGPDAVVVVDNGSADGSTEGLEPDVHLIRSPTNLGFAGALLEGLAATHEPFVLTLNPDIQLLPGCLQAAVQALSTDHRAGAVALRVLVTDEPSRVDATGVGLTSRLGQLNLDHGLRERDLDDVPRTVLGPLGGAALWRREALERAGNFDARFFLYWEEIDLCLRMDRAGYECRTVPTARVLHEGSGTVGRWSSQNVFYMVRNHWPCLVGSLPGRVLARRPLALFLAPIRAAILYALRGRPLAALAGLVCGAALVPGFLLGRRRLPRSGSGAKTAVRIERSLAAGDDARRRQKAAAGART